jgi:hypothetical protein
MLVPLVTMELRERALQANIAFGVFTIGRYRRRPCLGTGPRRHHDVYHYPLLLRSATFVVLAYTILFPQTYLRTTAHCPAFGSPPFRLFMGSIK